MRTPLLLVLLDQSTVNKAEVKANAAAKAALQKEWDKLRKQTT